MTEIISSTYEILEKLGAGGGGNVYLAYHRRLNKKVVLKADKRKLTTKMDFLRREVDILKNLSHQYIPQVYDFFIEDETIYTVMEYIDGESLDRPLKRGEKFSQKQVIFWAVELLQALSYLHNPVHGDPPRGFVHSDIKPANIMRRPNGDISLIDFNIALALGEDIVIGCTAGYASPEHYGLDFSTSSTSTTASMNSNSTMTLDNRTIPLSQYNESASGGSGSAKKMIVPDVRSDIYSLGATLYHLLCGRRPAQNALEVVPLSKDEFSPLLVDIISKSMNPNPDLRYQTADEMLAALYSLHEKDPRTIRLKKAQTVGYSLIALMLAAGIGTAFTGLKRMQASEENLKLAEYSATAYQSGDRFKALSLALEAIPRKQGLFDPKPSAQAQKALTDAVGIYDLADDFTPDRTIELPAEPFAMEMSPDGTTFSCIYAYELRVYDTATLEAVYQKPVAQSALSEVKYVSDSVIAYAGNDGLEVYDLSTQSLLWTGAPATTIAVSHDGSAIAALYKDDTSAAVYDAKSGEQLYTADFAGRKQRVAVNDIFANPHDQIFALNSDGSFLAVSFEDGSLQLFNLADPDNDLILLEDDSGFAHFEGGFYQKYFAFSASEANSSLFAVVDTKEQVQTGGFEAETPFGVKADERGIFLSYENVLVNIHPQTGDQTPLVNTVKTVGNFTVSDKVTMMSADTGYMYFDTDAKLLSEKNTDVSADFMLAKGDTAVIGSMNSTILKIEKMKDHSEADYILYDPKYAHDEARISHNQETLMLFAYDRFYILDFDGNLINETEIPDAENVYDQQYVRTADSSVLEVIYNDGKTVIYNALNGEIVTTEQREKPDLTLHQEFETEDYKVVFDLHGATVLYDRKNDSEIRELTEDAYLTYVTQVGDGLVLQYMTVDGYQYAKLLNENCSETAVMPYLSDIFEGKLIFDCPGGKIRTETIHSLSELIQSGESILEGAE